jgi:hypothetical protein
VSAEQLELTAAQQVALRWLHERGGGPWTGGSLVPMYAQRAADAARAEGHPVHHYTTPRAHAWRRTGGKVLEALHRAGAVRRSGGQYAPAYVITDAGRRFLQATKGENA